MESTMNCKLCLQRPADQKNSHIISKFLLKGLFKNVQKRALAIHLNGNVRKVQNTPKEDHILCSSCERRIGILETYFAPIIEKIHNYSNYPSEYKYYKILASEFLVCTEIDSTLFKLFSYSLIWRASITKVDYFENFKLVPHIEEELRVFLNTFLCDTAFKLDNFNSVITLDLMLPS